MEQIDIEPFVLPLADPGATLETAGGKGAALARLRQADFPTPPGFVVTTSAYRRFVAANDLQAAILDAAQAASIDDPASLDHASADIGTQFAHAAMPDAIAAEVRRAYAALDGDPPVAVRSSATAEDLPGRSFAGQQETFLNVRGAAALLEAVRGCWASLWTARAIGNRLRWGIDQQTVAMGVVVEPMIPAEVAGVLFTANPTTGDRTEMVINASYGLGEAIVSGRVTPDVYRVDRSTLRPLETTIGDKALAIAPAAGPGTVAEDVPAARRDEPALNDDQIRALADLAARVEALFGEPQDIEWAIADGHIWLLQARPMTGLPPAPSDVRWDPPWPGSKWLRRQVVENMPEPLSPLFADLFLRHGLELAFDRMAAVFGMPGELGDIIERPVFGTINGYAYSGVNMRLTWRAARIVVIASAKSFGFVFGHGIAYWREVVRTYLATVDEWRAIDPGAASNARLLAGIDALANAEAIHWTGVTYALAAAKVSDVFFDWFLNIVMPGRDLTSGRFLRGYPSPAIEAETDLEAIAAELRGSAALRALVAATPAPRLLAALAAEPTARPALEALRGYLDRYGRRIYSLDFALPTLADDPLPVLLNLKAQMDRPGPHLAARQAEIARERDQLVETTEASLDPLRRWLFQRAYDWARAYGPYRETALFLLGAAWTPLRALALELGRRLTAAGALAQPDDVFFLEQRELIAAGEALDAGETPPDLAHLAAERRALREAQKRLHPPPAIPPDFGLSFGPFQATIRESQRRNLGAGPELRGFAVSPGRATAPASVIRSPAEFDRMEPGAILVCPTTTPAWTPLFAQASGLVTDIGGVGAHGSIVAREYGIPAVMGVGVGTQRIAQGQIVTVDGDDGVVILDPAARPLAGPAGRQRPG